MKKQQRRGFTIVELVIVIAVIAILAAVLIPTFGSMIDKAQDSAATQAAKNAYTNYLIDNKGSAPDVMVYKHTNGKIVALENGAAVEVFETEAEFFAAYNLTAFDMEEGIIYTTIGDAGIGGNVETPVVPTPPSTVVELDVTYESGSVTSSGLAAHNTEFRSLPLSLGEYDFIDIQLLDDDYYFAVYAYNATNGKYSMVDTTNGWVYHGAVRVTDTNFTYLVRIGVVGGSPALDSEKCKDVIKVTGGNYTTRAEAAGGRAENENVYFDTDIAYYEHMIESTGYKATRANVISSSIPMLGYDGIRFEFTDSTYKYAIYKKNLDGSFAILTGGFQDAGAVFTVTDTAVVGYIVRVSRANGDGANFTQAEFDAAAAAVKVEHFCQTPVTVDTKTGYTRTYTNNTGTLTFENKEISGGAVVNNTKTLLAQLPNEGKIEVRANNVKYDFRVYSYDGTNYTDLTGGYTNYTYRYEGNASLTYYVQVRDHNNAAIATSEGSAGIYCYTYTDASADKTSNSKLYGKDIAIIGDSIVQGRYSNGSAMVGVVEKPWSNLISEACNTEPANFGLGGALVKNTDWKSLYLNCTKVVGFDVVFVCAGTNDFGNNTSEADFRAAFEYVIETLKANNTEVVVCTPVYRANKVGKNTADLLLSDYVQIEIEIAEEHGLKIIDLYRITNTPEFITTMTDKLHPDQNGHKIIAELVLKNY